MKTKFINSIIIGILLMLSNSMFSQSWEDQAVGILPPGYSVWSFSIVDENIVWGIAYYNNTSNGINHPIKVMRTLDGGENWEATDVEEAMGRISFDIEAIDENTAWITTNDFNKGPGRGVFKTVDGGETWVEKFHHHSGGVWIRFFNKLDGVLVNLYRIATTNDGGDTWNLLQDSIVHPFISGEFTGIYSGNNSCQIIDNHLWFGTTLGRVFRSKDKGHTWEAFDTGLGKRVYTVAFSDTLNGLAVGNQVPALLSRTQDGGETWNIVTSDLAIQVTNLTFVPGTKSTFVGTSISSKNSTSTFSTDYGVSWKMIRSFTPFRGVKFVSPNVGWTGRLFAQSNEPHGGNMFKWQGDIFVDTEELSVDKDYNIYPNPFIDDLTIENQRDITIEYKIFDTDGALIKSGTNHSQESVINLKGLNAGTYYLELISEAEVTTRKIIKLN